MFDFILKGKQRSADIYSVSSKSDGKISRINVDISNIIVLIVLSAMLMAALMVSGSNKAKIDAVNEKISGYEKSFDKIREAVGFLNGFKQPIFKSEKSYQHFSFLEDLGISDYKYSRFEGVFVVDFTGLGEFSAQKILTACQSSPLVNFYETAKTVKKDSNGVSFRIIFR